VVASISLGLACTIGAACTFPEVAFAPPGGADGGRSDANAEAGDGGDTDGSSSGDLDARVLIDGSDPDALIVHGDAGAKIDAATCGPSDCDCDGDGFKDTLKASCAGGLNDCDDKDGRTRPNQGYLVDKPESPVFGDWNCSGNVEKLYVDGFSCSALAPGKACNDGFGLAEQPECGGFGTLVKCKTQPVPPLNLTNECVTSTQTPNTQQACK
jgi:hypothetical protein